MEEPDRPHLLDVGDGPAAELDPLGRERHDPVAAGFLAGLEVAGAGCRQAHEQAAVVGATASPRPSPWCRTCAPLASRRRARRPRPGRCRARSSRPLEGGGGCGGLVVRARGDVRVRRSSTPPSPWRVGGGGGASPAGSRSRGGRRRASTPSGPTTPWLRWKWSSRTGFGPIGTSPPSGRPCAIGRDDPWRKPLTPWRPTTRLAEFDHLVVRGVRHQHRAVVDHSSCRSLTPSRGHCDNAPAVEVEGVELVAGREHGGAVVEQRDVTEAVHAERLELREVAVAVVGHRLQRPDPLAAQLAVVGVPVLGAGDEDRLVGVRAGGAPGDGPSGVRSGRSWPGGRRSRSRRRAARGSRPRPGTGPSSGSATSAAR